MQYYGVAKGLRLFVYSQTGRTRNYQISGPDFFLPFRVRILFSGFSAPENSFPKKGYKWSEGGGSKADNEKRHYLFLGHAMAA